MARRPAVYRPDCHHRACRSQRTEPKA